MCMKNKISGSCLCGNIAYEYKGKLGPSSYCHCLDCRKATGTAFLVSIRFDISDFCLKPGRQPARYSKTADSGKEIIREFCPDCGSPLFTFSPDNPDYVWVKAGSLDDPGIVKPAHQSWTDSRVDWSEIPDDIVSYAKNTGLLK